MNLILQVFIAHTILYRSKVAQYDKLCVEGKGELVNLIRNKNEENKEVVNSINVLQM